MRDLNITIRLILLILASLVICSCDNQGGGFSQPATRKTPKSLTISIGYKTEIADFGAYKEELADLITLDDDHMTKVLLSEDKKTVHIKTNYQNQRISDDMLRRLRGYPGLFAKIHHDNCNIMKNESLTISGTLKGKAVSYKDLVYQTSQAKLFSEPQKVDYKTYQITELFIPAVKKNRELANLENLIIYFGEESYLNQYHVNMRFNDDGDLTILIDRNQVYRDVDLGKRQRSYASAFEAYLSYRQVFNDIKSLDMTGLLTSTTTFSPEGTTETINDFPEEAEASPTPLYLSAKPLRRDTRLGYVPNLSNVISYAALGSMSDAKMAVPGSLHTSPNLLNVVFLTAGKTSRFDQEVQVGMTLNDQDFSDYTAYNYIDPVFSPDSSKTAYALQTDKGMQVINEAGMQSIPYEVIPEIIFSHDARTLVFIAGKFDHFTLVTNNREDSRLFKDMMSPLFSDDDQLLAFAGKQEKQWRLYINGEEYGKPHKEIHDYSFLPDSHKLVLFADGTAYLEGQRLPGLKGKTFSEFTPMQASLHGEHLAFMAQQKQHTYLYYDGKLTKINGEVMDSLYLSKDGLHLAYGLKIGDACYYIVDGQKYGPYEDLKYQGLNFSPDSQHVAFNAKVKGAWVSVIDGVVGPAFSDMPHGGPMFSPDSQHIVYFGKKNGIWHIVKDGQDFYASNPLSTEEKILRFDDLENFHYISQHEQDISLNKDAVRYIRPIRLDRFDSLVAEPITNLPDFYRSYVTDASGPDAWSEYCIGMMYFSGAPLKKDLGEGYSHLKKALDQQLPIALAKRGNMYLTGEYSEINYERAYDRSLSAAKQANPEGIFNLGQLYQYGDYVKQDKEVAYAHYQLYLEMLGTLSISDPLATKYAKLLAAQLSTEQQDKALSMIPALKTQYEVTNSTAASNQ